MLSVLVLPHAKEGSDSGMYEADVALLDLPANDPEHWSWSMSTRQ